MSNNDQWIVELSAEVERWLDGLKQSDRVIADGAIQRLRDQGPYLQMPHSKLIEIGLRELRFICQDVPARVTYYFASQRRVVMLTTFRKQSFDVPLSV